MNRIKSWLPAILMIVCLVCMAAVPGIFSVVNSTAGYQVNGSAGTSGQALCSDGTNYDTPCSLPTLYYQTINSNGTAQTQRSAINFSPLFSLTDSSSPSETNVALLTYGNGTRVATLGSNPTTSTNLAVFDGNGNLVPASTGVGTDYYFSFTGCSVVNSGNLNACTGTVQFTSGGNTTPTFPAMADTAYQIMCNVDTGTVSSAAFGVSNTSNTSATPSFTRTTIGFGYTWTEVMSLGGDGSNAPQIDCHLHHN